MKTEQYKLDYIREHLDLTATKLADILKMDRHTVSKYKKQFGYIPEIKDFHKYDDYIIENYYKKTASQLSNEIGCSQSYIAKIWSKAGLKGKGSFRYYCNQNFFKNTNENSSYIIGLLASDGCLYKRDNHQGLIQLSLSKEDIKILQDILIVLESTHPINKNEKNATISITSDIMFKDLNKIGLCPQKTWTINMKKVLDNIPTEYHKDFYRGYLDGDGCITSSDHFKTISNTNIKIAVPETTGLIFKQDLLNFNIESVFQLDNRKDHYKNNFGTLTFNNTTHKYCFLKWIYSEKYELKLERKEKLAKDFILKVENNVTNRSENIKALEYYKNNFIRVDSNGFKN